MNDYTKSPKGDDLSALHYLIVVATLLGLGSCTYYVPAQLAVEHTGDTLSVALAGNGAARWDPQKDSLVITCSGCSEQSAKQVEHFQDCRRAEFDVQNSQGLTLTLYSMGEQQTMTISGNAQAGGTLPELTPLPTHHARRRQIEENSVTTAKTEEPQKIVKKATSLKVTAAEGVAIYKDKTKNEVLKIVPQGSILILLSREGDLYSVSVDGDEGFVDAEAVEEQN